MADSVIETILKLSPDKAALKASVAGAEQLVNVLEQTRKRTISVDDAAVSMNKHLADIARQRAIEQLTSELAGSVREGGRLNDELFVASKALSSLGASEDEIRGVARALADAAENAERLDRAGTGGSGGGRLDQIDRSGAVGSQILSGLGQGEAANVAGLIGDTVGAISSLNPVMLGLTAAGAGLALVLGNAASETTKVTEATTERLDSEAELYRFLARASRDQIENRLEEERTNLRIEEAILRRQQRELDEINYRIEVEGSAFDYVRSRLGLAFGEWQALTNTITEQTDTVEDLRITVDGLTAAFYNADPVLRQIYNTLELIADAEEKIDGLADELRAASEAAFDEKQALEESNAAKGETIKLAELEAALLKAANAEKQRQLELLQQEQAALAAHNITLQYDAQLNTLEQLGRAQSDVDKAQQAYNTTLTQSEGKLADINAQLIEQLANAESTRLEALNKAEEQAGEARLKAIETFHEQEKRINARYESDRLNAIGERDAEAAFNATKSREEQLQEQEQQLSKQELEVERSLRKQREAVEDSYRKQVDTARTAANRAIQLEIQRRDTELQIRQQTLQVALTQLQNFQAGAIAIMQQLVASTANMQYGANYGTPVQVPLPGGGSQPGWAVDVQTRGAGDPGYNDPNYGRPMAAGGGSGGGMTANFNVVGTTPNQVRRQIDGAREELVQIMFGGA